MDQFPLDVFQTGSGTSSNMNANEVIAALRAAERLGAAGAPQRSCQRGRQSSNDVFPSAIHIAASRAGSQASWSRRWSSCAAALEAKAREFADVVKSRAGRT